MLLMSERKKPKTKAETKAEADRHLNPKLQFHLPPDLREALEEYMGRTKPTPTYTAVLRLALEEFLERAGVLPKQD